MDRSRIFMLLAVLLFVGLVGAYFGPMNREHFSGAIARAAQSGATIAKQAEKKK